MLSLAMAADDDEEIERITDLLAPEAVRNELPAFRDPRWRQSPWQLGRYYTGEPAMNHFPYEPYHMRRIYERSPERLLHTPTSRMSPWTRARQADFQLGAGQPMHDIPDRTPSSLPDILFDGRSAAVSYTHLTLPTTPYV